MRAIADDQLEATKTFAEEMYFCLGCLACMTACPAGVNYAELFERARAEAERSGVLKSPRRSLIRKLTINWLFMDHHRLQTLGRVLRLYQSLGLQSLVRKSGILKLMPKRLRELEAMTPTVEEHFSNELISPVTPATTKTRYRVAVLTGCAQDLVLSSVNLDTVEVLARNGCEVITPPSQNCCGSLHAHNGEWDMAKEKAAAMIEQFPPDEFDAIITNAAGCGSHLKHFQSFLKSDPRHADRARLWDAKVKDIHEWLVEIGCRPPRPPVVPASPVKATYHEACHLAHGQSISRQPRQLLHSLPGFEWVELPEATWCCGSAGIYNIVQPETAEQLLQRKLDHIESTGARVLATGNPGCLLQIINGARKRGLDLEVCHPVSLLARAYREESPSEDLAGVAP